MSSQDDSTVSMKPPWKDWRQITKSLTAAVLLAVAIFVGVTRDWIGVTKEGAVSSERVVKVETELREVKTEYVRKEALEPRLSALEKTVDEMRSDQKEANRLLQQILIEQRRR